MIDPFDPFGKDAPSRLALSDPAALDELRRHVFESVGAGYAPGILYGIGLSEGLVDGLRIARGFTGASPTPPQVAGPPLGLLFQLDPGPLDERFAGTLRDSLEAALHLAAYDRAESPACALSAGYAAGWYSAITGDDILVLERECAASGAVACRFEARPVARWIVEREREVIDLLPYLDFNALRQRARDHIDDGGASDEIEGDMMGAFDSMSPAVHVWGAVMVLPYSGPQDSKAAIETIEADIGEGAVEVAVVDVTGAHIAPAEAHGLVSVIDALEARHIETVLVGLPRNTELANARGGPWTAMPIRARDISEGIALAFQLTTSGRSEPS